MRHGMICIKGWMDSGFGDCQSLRGLALGSFRGKRKATSQGPRVMCAYVKEQERQKATDRQRQRGEKRCKETEAMKFLNVQLQLGGGQRGLSLLVPASYRI